MKFLKEMEKLSTPIYLEARATRSHLDFWEIATPKSFRILRTRFEFVQNPFISKYVRFRL